MDLSSINSKELIEYIAKEVIKQIKSIENKEATVEVEKDKILAIPISNNKFLENYEDHFQIDYINDIKEDIDINSYKCLVLEGICIQRLVSISMGLTGDKISSTVIDFILQDKKIYILNEGVEYRQYKNTSNISFYNMLKSYEDKLKGFGIDFINKLDLKSISKNMCQDRLVNSIDNQIEERDIQKTSKRNLAYKIESKILTEGNLRKIHQEGHTSILLQKKAIITPLAKDYIKSNGIDVLIE